MKKGTLAAAGLAVGAGATSTAAAGQQQEEEGQIVLPGRDYYPNGNFDIVAEFDTGQQNDLLELFEEEFQGGAEDWSVYGTDHDVGTPGDLGYVMVDDDELDLSVDDTVTVDTDASFRNAELALVEVSASLNGVDDEEEMNDEEEETNGEEEETNGNGTNGDGDGDGNGDGGS